MRRSIIELLSLPQKEVAQRHIGYGFIVLFCAALMTALVLAFPLNPYPTFPNTKKVTAVTLCAASLSDCEAGKAQFQPVTLPVFLPPVKQDGTHAATFRFEFDMADIDSNVGAIFIPRFSDGLLVELNGDPISPNTDNFGQYRDRAVTRLWHLPFYTTISGTTVRDRGNVITIELEAYNYTRLALSPVYIGDAFRLRIANQYRFIARNGYLRVAFTFQIGFGIFLGLLWRSRRKDSEYGWALAANISASVICWHHILPNTVLSDSAWTLTWNIAIQVYIYALYRYSRAIMNIPISRAVWLVTGYCGLSTLALCAVPVSHLAAGLKLYHLGNGVLALLIPYLFLTGQRTRPFIYMAHFFIFILVFSFAFRDYLYVYWAPERVGFQIGQFIPLIIFMTITGLLITRLALSLNESEATQRTMAHVIEQKSAEIVAQEKQLTIDHERHRMMLDLHDGVGGQLVNTLSYMRRQESSDPIVRSSVEAALRDMALIIDSLEGYDDLPTLLGSLRARIEPLLDENHVRLVWQLRGAPDIEPEQRSHNLNIIRIIQEAITNAVKHGQPETITIISDDHSISVIDDGTGFDLEKARQKTGTNSGIGLEGMQHRAQDIGITCKVMTSPAGTQIQLLWP